MSIYQIVVQGVFDDTVQLRNVHHYEFPAYVPSTAELQEAVDALDADYKTHLQGSFSTLVDFISYDVRRVDVGDLPSALFTATAGTWSGTETNHALPPQVSAMVTFKAPTTFPRTSRTYHFPFTEASNGTDGQISAGAIINLDLWAAAVLTLPITGQTDASKVAVKYGGDPRAVTDSNTIVSDIILNTWRSQRRRVPGVGV